MSCRIICLYALFLSLLWSTGARAYPNFISYGYQSCLSCHFNPYGGGALTDYGRAVGATEISDRMFRSDATSEETIAQQSDFFFGQAEVTKSKPWFRPSASYRGLYLQRNFDNSRTRETEYITMDAGVAVAMTFLENKMVVVGQMGYAPIPLAAQGTNTEDLEEYRSREHYIGYRLDKEIGVYAGLMDKVYGIRVPDHTAYSRRETSNNQNDQVHGILAHYAVDPIEFGIHLFVGNLVQDKDLRQRGVAGQVEYNLGKSTRVGVSMLSSVSDYKDLEATALMFRTGMGKGNSLMLEVGRVKTQPVTQDQTLAHYLFLQNHFNFRRGLFGISTVEAYYPSKELRDYRVRFGPGVQWFPIPKLEIRTDIYNTKIYGTSAVSDTWYLASQVHLWF